MIQKHGALLVFVLAGWPLLNPAAGQEITPFPQSALKQNTGGTLSRAISVSPNEEYRLGPKDVIEVYILRLPELSREYEVRADGTIEMPFIGKIEAQKKTSADLVTLIANRLRNGYLVDPQVSIIVKQVSRQFFIQGAVRSPGVYNIEGRPSLLQLITIAGGLNSSYGATAFIIRGIRQSSGEVQAVAVSEPEPRPDYELRKANINALLRGDFAENVSIEPGDIVHIPPTDVFFVGGEVKAPGSFPLKEGTTLRQALSLAQGTNPFAARGKAVIFREDAGGQKREIPVDVAAVMGGRRPDLPILPNDVIVVPNSKAKSAFMPVINAFGMNAAWTVATFVH
jgi:polysaccharide export outer membrane protein